MKKIPFYIFLLLLCLVQAGAADIPTAPNLPATKSAKDAQAPITLQFPQENAYTSRGATAIYVFGKLNVPNATLDINGKDVYVYKNGAFIAFIPVEQGPFSILLTAKSNGKTYQAVRHVTVPGTPLTKLEGKAQFDEKEIYPSHPVWVLPGDTIQLSARGTPGAKVKASLPHLPHGKNISLTEQEKTPGLYQASYTIPHRAKPQSVKVVYTLDDPQTKTQAKVTAHKSIKILNNKEPMQPALVKDPGVKLRLLPVHQGSLYPFHRAFGEVLIRGRENGLYRLDLKTDEVAWLEESKLSLLSHTDFQNSHIHSLKTLSSPTVTSIEWELSKQTPLTLHEFSNRFEITFYYMDDFDENFNFDATSPILDKIEWKEDPQGVLNFVLYFKEHQLPWGYAYHYEDNRLILELRHPPVIEPTKEKPLNGARILIDAGHSPKRKPPYDGLVSPSGFLEYEANLALAEELKPKLEAAGAIVIMTRHGNNQMSLLDRYTKALEEEAHIFVSLHHNAFGDTVNPLVAPHGFSIYYTYPHSFKLAESVHKSFTKSVPLHDSGLIANDVLFIPRISEMPSILIENAFMILPDQESLVMSEAGRKLFAETIYQGILRFYQPEPPVEKPQTSGKKNAKKK